MELVWPVNVDLSRRVLGVRQKKKGKGGSTLAPWLRPDGLKRFSGSAPLCTALIERADEPILLRYASIICIQLYQPTLIMAGFVQNIIGPDMAGYIRKEILEAKLRTLFGCAIPVRHINERFVFNAPRLLTQSEIDDLRD
ncbi:hypothetical protein BDV28DRAFT_153385 [Aspergillus coremiiformis]|uniref:Uncharacterized protein n=1 Tax=Aspergillus coremiiformis TaxID=138285 RepID=A0A5N6YR71_9EURO|nr:hypothetical protein BDV28DRAFT_153385 [Aspergillus coremiiformis]